MLWTRGSSHSFLRQGYSANPPFGSGTSTVELAALARQYFNLPNSTAFSGWTLGQLQNELDNGNPVVVYVETWMIPINILTGIIWSFWELIVKAYM